MNIKMISFSGKKNEKKRRRRMPKMKELKSSYK